MVPLFRLFRERERWDFLLSFYVGLMMKQLFSYPSGSEVELACMQTNEQLKKLGKRNSRMYVRHRGRKEGTC